MVGEFLGDVDAFGGEDVGGGVDCGAWVAQDGGDGGVVVAEVQFQAGFVADRSQVAVAACDGIDGGFEVVVVAGEDVTDQAVVGLLGFAEADRPGVSG
ncbi:hypothetical protein Srufu_014960 [Streptomyces libani subsp. rufus]|nr:hypothetical protein Srufu_014960 [Streptomyces libani subsp. rufus]